MVPMTDTDHIMHAYTFHGYARRNTDVAFVPSLIGTPISGSAASEAYYVRHELPTRRITTMAKTHYVEQETKSPIVAIRLDNGASYYIPKDELEEIAAAHQDDDIFSMLNSLYHSRVY